MATSQTTDKKDDKPVDHVPELPDDAPAEQRAEQAAAPESNDDDGGSDKVPAGLSVIKDDERDRIVQRHRELRAEREAEAKAKSGQAQQAETGNADNEADTGAGAGDNAAGEDGANESENAASTADSATQPPAGTQPAPTGQSAQPVEIELIVDGKPRLVSMDEAKRLAQLQVAGDNRLDETKRLLKEATELVQRTRAGEHQPGTEADPAHPQNPTDQSQARTAPEHQRAALDPEKLKDIVGRIQVGNEDEGTAALVELVGMLGAQQGVQVDEAAIERRVQEALTRQQAHGEINSALAEFAQAYAPIVQDKHLKTVGLEMVADEIVADLKKVGISDQDIAPVLASPNKLDLLAQAHHKLRAANHSVRPVKELLSTVGEAMNKKFKLVEPKPATQQQRTTEVPAATLEARQAAKRAQTVQPRSSGVRGQIATAPPPKTRRDIVNEQRKVRGYDVH